MKVMRILSRGHIRRGGLYRALAQYNLPLTLARADLLMEDSYTICLNMYILSHIVCAYIQIDLN